MRLQRYDNIDDITKLAMDTAEQHSLMAFRHSAVLLSSDNKLLATGFNLSYGGYLQHGMFSRHAESMAIAKATRKFGKKMVRGAKIYIFKLTGAGVLAPVKVCDNCRIKLEKAGIAEVYFQERTEPIKNETNAIVARIRSNGTAKKCHKIDAPVRDILDATNANNKSPQQPQSATSQHTHVVHHHHHNHAKHVHYHYHYHIGE
jgi:deoxycytidylate deaminase